MKKEITMNEEIKDIEGEEIVDTEPKKGIGSKIIGGIKKHGKKVVAGAAVIGVGLIGYALGAKNSGGEECDGCCFEDDDFDEVFPAEDDTE